MAACDNVVVTRADCSAKFQETLYIVVVSGMSDIEAHIHRPAMVQWDKNTLLQIYLYVYTHIYI